VTQAVQVAQAVLLEAGLLAGVQAVSICSCFAFEDEDLLSSMYLNINVGVEMQAWKLVRQQRQQFYLFEWALEERRRTQTLARTE
jgi:hypothetical protein